MQVMLELHEKQKAEEAAEAQRQDEKRAAKLLARRNVIPAVTDEGSVTPEYDVRAQIDRFAEGTVLPNNVVVLPRPKKLWVKRPAGWKVIGEHYNLFGMSNTLRTFEAEFVGRSLPATEQAIRKYGKDVTNGKEYLGQVGPPPVIGVDLDKELYNRILVRIDRGLSVDNTIVRTQLLELLMAHDKTELLKANGGPCTLSNSWARRFFKRHKLVCRRATTKMRELPADFLEKQQSYFNIGSILIHTHNIPEGLVIGCDETNVLFVSRMHRTYSRKGSRKVKLFGVGDDKAQITATLFATDAGDVLDHQLIFGGRTNRCHPSHAPPPGCHFAHTPSHWQSEDTYIEVIEDIVVPYKNKFIHDHNLPANQVSSVIFNHTVLDPLIIFTRHVF